MTKIAVIGAGAMGKNHLRVLNELPEVELIAVADASKKTAEEMAKKFKIKSYTDFNELLEKEKLDAITIAVPTSEHKNVAFKAIEKGIPFLLEKPIACSSSEAQEIIDFAEEKKVKFAVGHVERFNPAVQEIKKRLEKNELGKVFKLVVRRIGPFPPRVRDVGVVIDLAVHDLDVINYLFESKVKRIFAEVEQKVHTEKEDLLVALLKLENNALCVLNIDWLTPRKIRELAVTGDKGRFEIDYLNQELSFYENAFINGDMDYDELVKGIIEGNMTKLKINKKEPLKIEIESFIEFIQGKGNSVVSGEEAKHALFLAEKIIESAQNQKVVVL